MLRYLLIILQKPFILRMYSLAASCAASTSITTKVMRRCYERFGDWNIIINDRRYVFEDRFRGLRHHDFHFNRRIHKSFPDARSSRNSNVASSCGEMAFVYKDICVKNPLTYFWWTAPVLSEKNIQAVVCVNIDNDRRPPLPGAKKRYFSIMVAFSRRTIHVQIECTEILIWSRFHDGLNDFMWAPRLVAQM